MAKILIEKNTSGYLTDLLFRFDGDYCKFTEQKRQSILSDFQPIDPSFLADEEAFLNTPIPK